MDERDPRTYAVIGAAMEVHNELGPGFLEAVYHDCLELEFSARSIPHRREVFLPVRYKGQALKAPYRADFLCFDEVVVEVKAKRDLAAVDRNQILHYLKAAGLTTGILLNFGEPRLQVQRFRYDPDWASTPPEEAHTGQSAG